MSPPLRRSWTAHGPLPVLLDAFAPARAPALHPLIRAVSDVHDDGDGVVFTIDERVPLGPLSLPNRYRARLSRPADGRVRRVRRWVAAEAARRACGGDGLAPSDEPYRRGMWRVWGARAGVGWEVLASENGAAFLRFPGVAPSGGSLAPGAAFGRGGLSGEGYSRVEGGPFADWWAAGGVAWTAGLAPWVEAALLADPDGGRSIVDGALVIVGEDPGALLDALLGPGSRPTAG